MLRSIRGKRGQEGGSNWLLVALIVGAIVLILVLTGAGKKIIDLFKTSSASTSTSTIDVVRTKCANACATEQKFTFCCEPNKIKYSDGTTATLIGCTDSKLVPSDCSINCAGFSCATPLPDECIKQKLANGNLGKLAPSCASDETPIDKYKESILKIGYTGDARYTCSDQIGTWKDNCITTGTATETEITQASDREVTPAGQTAQKCCVPSDRFGKLCCAKTEAATA